MAVNILLKRSSTASKRPVGASMAFGELNLNYDAATGGLYYKNSAGDVVKVGPCQVSSTAPNATPAGSAGNSAGEFWFDSSTGTLKVYDGTTWQETGGAVQGVTGTAPVSVDNTDPLNPIISVDAATTTAPGVVQLNDSTTSTSTTEALTAAQGKVLQDQIDALAITSNLTFAGTLDTATGNLVTVSTEGAAQGFVIGSPLPAAAAGNEDFFVIVTVADDAYTPPGGSPTLTHVGDWFLSDGTVWQFLDVGFQAPYASTSTPGIVQLATDAEVQAGVNTDHAVTPSGLQSKVSDSVSTTSSTTLASSTAAKDAYDAGIQGQTDAAAAQATADAAMPKAGGSFTGSVNFESGVSFLSGSVTEFAAGSTLDLNTTTNVQGDFTVNGPGTFAVNGTTADFINGVILTLDSTSSAFLDGTFTFGATSVTTVEGEFAFEGVVDISNELLLTGDVGTAGYILQSNGPGLAPTWVANGADGVQGVTGTSPISVDNTDPANPVIGVDAASTTASGVVQLDDTVTSTSTTEAATANAAKTAYDAAVAAQATADAALPKAGGEVTGAVTLMPGAYITADSGSDLELYSGSGAGFTLSGDAIGSISAGSIGLEAIGTDPQALSLYAVDSDIHVETQSINLAIGGPLNINGASGTAGYILQSNGPSAAPTWVANAADGVQGVTGTAPITVDNTDPANPIIDVDAASTSAAGVVQLNDTVTSTSTSEAATANAAKTAYDKGAEALTFAQTLGITSDTVIYVNTTDGDDLTGTRGTTKAFKTITAALAAASENDTVYLSPGTFIENVTLTKGVNLVGTMNDQVLGAGTKIQGNFVVNATASMTKNWAISHVYFISTNSTPPFSITANSFGAGGTGNVWRCDFTQQTSSDPTQYAVTTSGTWTRSVYFRDCLFDGNFHHNAGTAAGASGYAVIDRLLGSGSSGFYHRVTTGTVEFRNPSNSLAPIFQTGGVALVNGATAGITPSAAGLNSVFGTTGFSYKGSAASAGTGTVYFQAQTQGTGKIDIGANLIYGYTDLIMDPANLTVSGSAVAYTTAVPAAANAQTMSQQRPRLDLLKSTSSVAASNQLATVVDSSTGAVYTVTAMDAGTY